MTKDNKSYGAINRFFNMPVIVAMVMLISGAISGLAVYFLTASKTEKDVKAAVLEEITVELKLHSENQTLSEAILQIKNEKAELKKEIEKTKSDLETANAKIKTLTDSSEDNLSAINKELENTKSQLDTANAALAAYQYSSPKVTVDGLPVTTDKDSVLSHNGRVYYDESIIKHFFSEEQITLEDGQLDFSTKGSVATINPQLNNSVGLGSMDVANMAYYIGFTPILDNNNSMHHNDIYATYPNEQYIEYRLDKNYRWFDCSAFVTKAGANHSYDDSIWSSVSVSITADNGIKLWGSESFSRDAEIQYSGIIDISGTKYIRITFYNACDYDGNAYIAITEPKLYLE